MTLWGSVDREITALLESYTAVIYKVFNSSDDATVGVKKLVRGGMDLIPIAYRFCNWTESIKCVFCSLLY